MGYQLGIDIGSAHTIVGIADGGWPRVLELGGQRRLPSVAYAPAGGGLQFARAAARRAHTDPDRSATDLLRRLGEESPVLLGGAAFSREGLLGRYVAYLVTAASEQLGGPPDQVVVSYPSFWQASRREVFAEAIGELSGLEMPVTAVAAAEAMGTLLARSSLTQTVDLVGWYGLGAGFCDTAVLSFSPFGFQVVGTPAGLRHGAGLDVDGLLVDRALERAGTVVDRSDPATRVALARLRRDAAQAKEILAEEGEVELPVALPGVDLSVQITRDELETLVGPTIDDTVGALRRAMRSVPAGPSDLSRILLSGGVTYLPLVARRLRAEFPEITRVEHRADADLAMGAALLAADLADRATRSGPGVFGAAAGEEYQDITAVIRPPDSASLTSLPPFMSGAGLPPAGTAGVAGAAGAAAQAADVTQVARYAQPTGLPPAADVHHAAGYPPAADATQVAGLSLPGDATVLAAPSEPVPAGTVPTVGLGYGGRAGAGDQPAGLAPVVGPPAAGGPGSGGTAGAGRDGGRRGGGLLGSRRAMIAAAIVAVLFVAGGTTAGVLLTGQDSGASDASVLPATLPVPTTGPVDPIPAASAPAQPPASPNLVRVAGSSEVAPITETAYNEFRQTQRNVTVNVEATSTEDGFEALCSGKADLADASFEPNPGSLKDPSCAKKLIGFEVAHHTLPIVVNPQNDWLHCLTLKQVRQLWGAESTITRWNQLDRSYPDEPITFIGPARTSVQAQVFNATISDASDRSRAYQQTDLSGVANDVAGDRLSVGYLDYPTLATFGDRLRGVDIDNGKGCVQPTAAAVGTGAYLPLCKPLFVYAHTDGLRNPATAAFLRFYLQNGKKIAFDAHYVPRSDATVGENVSRLAELTTGVGPVPA